jgi:beta-galactosidase
MIGQGAEARPAYTANMIRAEQLWKFNALHDYVTGYFMWTGIDYLGESRWPRRSATSGVLDQCGFPKDGFYFYQSLWTQAPMVHLLPHWTWKGREGQVIPVVAYTNCDTVELTLNGRSLGVRALAFPREGTVGGWNTYARPDRATPSTADLHATWDVPYEPGTLRAIGRRRGEIVAQEEVKTAGEPAALVATVDRRTVAASTRGVAHVAVRVVDAQGVPVPDAANAVTFELSGPAQLLAVDNGDPAGHDAFQTDHVAAFHGQALALVQAGRAGGGAGRVRVAARAAGLKEAVVEVEVVPGVAVPAVP